MKHSRPIAPAPSAQFLAVCAMSRDGILLADDEGRYVDANDAACALLGMKKEKILGRRVEEFADPQRKDEVKESWGRFLKEGHQKGVFRIYRPDGTTRFVEYSAKANILPHQHLSILRDITERNQAERSLRESEDRLRLAVESAQSATRAKSQFIANISHEIRTPINGILGTIELLRQTAMTPEQKEYSEIMQDSGETLMALVNGLLDFSRMEAGKLKLETKSIDLIDTLRAVLSLFAEQVHSKKLKLTSAVQEGTPFRLRGDPVRLRQVLMNLIGNAVKFTERGGVSVGITCEKEDASQAVLRFSIRDTGPGIAENQQGLLFQPFSQVDSSTMRQHGGTGLGLAISKQLVELMGGSIGLLSAPDQGATFWFTVPFEKQPGSPRSSTRLTASKGAAQEKSIPETPPAGLPAPTPSLGMRILVAEDNRINRRVAVRQLQKLGYTAETAANGHEVLKAMEGKCYDLIFMDCQMPQMDGYQATREIRRSEKGRSIPIIAMTAHALEDDRQKCLDAGMNDYLTKPVQMAQLQTLLQKYLGEPALIDTRQLSQVVSLEGEDYEELVDMYMKDTASQLNQLEAAIQKKSAPQVRDIAHAALGASAMLGMKGIGNLLRQLQEIGERGDLTPAAAALREARETLSRTQAYLAKLKVGAPC